MRRRLPVDELLEFDSRRVVKFMKHSIKQLRITGDRGIAGLEEFILLTRGPNSFDH